MDQHFLSRRKFLEKIVLTSAGAVITTRAFSRLVINNPISPSLKDKKVLMVWGGWMGHEPKKCIDIFAPWAREQWI